MRHTERLGARQSDEQQEHRDADRERPDAGVTRVIFVQRVRRAVGVASVPAVSSRLVPGAAVSVGDGAFDELEFTRRVTGSAGPVFKWRR